VYRQFLPSSPFSSIVGLYRILAFATILMIILIELLLEIHNLGGEGDDLGI